MFDTKNIYVLRAKRTLRTHSACTRALKSLIRPLTDVYHVKPTNSENALFQATGGDVDVHLMCSYVESSPYSTLGLSISSKAEKNRVSEMLKKAYGR